MRVFRSETGKFLTIGDALSSGALTVTLFNTYRRFREDCGDDGQCYSWLDGFGENDPVPTHKIEILRGTDDVWCELSPVEIAEIIHG